MEESKDKCDDLDGWTTVKKKEKKRKPVSSRKNLPSGKHSRSSTKKRTGLASSRSTQLRFKQSTSNIRQEIKPTSLNSKTISKPNRKKHTPITPSIESSPRHLLPENAPLVVSTADDLKGHSEYSDGKLTTKTVIFGSAKMGGLFGLYWQDVMENGYKSQFAGQVLCAESPDKIDRTWSPDRSRAFFLSAMEECREFLLATDVKFYQTAKIKDKNTIHEILWLINNGYTAAVSDENPQYTVFTPPTELAKIGLIHYEKMVPYSTDYIESQQQLTTLISAIVEAREVKRQSEEDHQSLDSTVEHNERSASNSSDDFDDMDRVEDTSINKVKHGIFAPAVRSDNKGKFEDSSPELDLEPAPVA